MTERGIDGFDAPSLNGSWRALRGLLRPGNTQKACQAPPRGEGRFGRQISLREFVKRSRIASLTYVGIETAIPALMAYEDVPLKCIVIVAFFALAHRCCH